MSLNTNHCGETKYSKDSSLGTITKTLLILAIQYSEKHIAINSKLDVHLIIICAEWEEMECSDLQD